MAAIVLASHRKASFTHIRKARESGMHIVCIDRVPPCEEIDSVTVNNVGSAFDCVRHLIAVGHRRIAILTGGLKIQTGRDRLRGYEQVLSECGSGLEPIRTGIQSPWQNGVGERWVGSIRRELLDHVIPLNEYHLRRLGREYLAYYQEDRTHDGLGKQTPGSRRPQTRPDPTCSMVGLPCLGGLPHRYEWSRAA